MLTNFNKMHYIGYFISILSLITILHDPYPDIRPPGTVKVAENFYADVSELSNLSYREYLDYIERIWGKTSDIYIDALPDTTVWRSKKWHNEPYVVTYFRYSAYNEYPVVGVSHPQAVDYSDWRTDRVTEMILLQDGIIKPNEQLTSDNYFTVDRYREGNYNWIIKHQDIMIPKYSLPTEQEWETIARGHVINEYGLDSLNRKIKKALKKKRPLYNTKIQNSDNNITLPPQSSISNATGLQHTIGNVAEMLDDNDIVKGGSFQNELIECQISKVLKSNSPSYWIGFRNICRWEKIEVK